MQRSIRRKLIDMNLDLYQRFATEFSESRKQLQPGILRALASLGDFDRLADIGCGDARVGRALRSGEAGPGSGPWSGTYLGIDGCEALLELAPAESADFRLVAADLTEPGWAGGIPCPESGYAAMVLFSFLHHVPGAAERLEFLRECASLLAPDGRWAVSVWQFLHLERFRRRVLPWSEIDLAEDDIEPGDILHDWRRGGHALRYVHSFGAGELSTLCEDAGLAVDEQYRSDGESGDLGLYLVGRKAQ